MTTLTDHIVRERPAAEAELFIDVLLNRILLEAKQAGAPDPHAFAADVIRKMGEDLRERERSAELAAMSETDR